MSPPIATTLVTLGLLTLLGLAPALIVGRSRAWTAALTPVAGALVGALGATLSVLTGTSMVPWLVASAVVGWAGLLARRHHRLLDRLGPPPAVSAEGVTLTVAALVALLPVALVDLPATVSDARSIWWLHAAWFRAGGRLAAQAMEAPAYGGSLPSHPPLVPSVIAAVWHVDGAYDRAVAIRVSEVITAYAAAALGFFTAQVLRLTGGIAVLVAGAATWLAWSAKVSVGLNGLVDLTWALLFVTGALLWLVADTGRRTLTAGALFIAAAVLTKSEGQVAGLLVAVLATVRLRATWRRAVVVWAGVLAPIALWRTVVTPTRFDTGDLSLLPEVLQPGTLTWTRFTTALDTLASHLGPLVGLGAVVVLAAAWLLRGRDTPVSPRSLLTLLGLAGALTVVNAAIYAIRPEEMDVLVQSAAYRSVVVTRLLVTIAVVLATVSVHRSGDRVAALASPALTG